MSSLRRSTTEIREGGVDLRERVETRNLYSQLTVGLVEELVPPSPISNGSNLLFRPPGPKETETGTSKDKR